MAVTLYKRQRQVLDFIVQYIQKHGYSPTLRDIADALGLSAVSTVHEHIVALEDKGVLKRHHDERRGFEITDENIATLHRAVKIPILGKLDPGVPIQKVKEEQFLHIPNRMIDGKERAYALKVDSNNLSSEGVLHGDFLIVEEEQELEEGQPGILILKDGSAVAKRFFRETTRIRLEPLYSQQRPEFVNELQIQGKIAGVIRQF